MLSRVPPLVYGGAECASILHARCLGLYIWISVYLLLGSAEDRYRLFGCSSLTPYSDLVFLSAVFIFFVKLHNFECSPCTPMHVQFLAKCAPCTPFFLRRLCFKMLLNRTIVALLASFTSSGKVDRFGEVLSHYVRIKTWQRSSTLILAGLEGQGVDGLHCHALTFGRHRVNIL